MYTFSWKTSLLALSALTLPLTGAEAGNYRPVTDTAVASTNVARATATIAVPTATAQGVAGGTKTACWNPCYTSCGVSYPVYGPSYPIVSCQPVCQPRPYFPASPLYPSTGIGYPYYGNGYYGNGFNPMLNGGVMGGTYLNGGFGLNGGLGGSYLGTPGYAVPFNSGLGTSLSAPVVTPALPGNVVAPLTVPSYAPQTWNVGYGPTISQPVINQPLLNSPFYP